MSDSLLVDTSPANFDEADLEAIRQSISLVLTEQCDSVALHAYVDGKAALAANLEAQAVDLGWIAIGLPEEHGGFGLGVRGLQLLHHELGLVAAPGGFLATGVAAQVLAEAGEQDQIASAWRFRLASGEVQAAIPAALDATLALADDGTISGKVILIGAPGAAIALVTVGQEDVAIVELDGLNLTPLDFWDRTRSLSTLELDQVTPAAWLGKDACDRLLRAFAIAVAADSIGLARGIATKTIAYMKERVQFGRPIGSFQALKHRAVDLVARIGVVEHTLAQAVETAHNGSANANMWARLAKAATSEAAVFVAGDCVQLHGGVGFTWEFDVHLYLKRARLNEMLVGDNLRLRDAAAVDLAWVTRSGESSLELSAL